MAIRVNVTMPEKFLEAVDDAAREEHRGRSELIREALRLYLSRVGESGGGAGEAKRKVEGDTKAMNAAREAAPVSGTPGTGSRQALRDILRGDGDVELAFLLPPPAAGGAGIEGEAHLAVLLKKDLTGGTLERKRLELRRLAAGAAGPDVADVIVLNRAPPGLSYDVAGKGRAAYEKEDGVRQSFEVSAINGYLDFAKVEKEYNALLAERIKKGEMVSER
ncbi:MAG: ribbon-helix-helix domain-containing protein [Actinomycetota bacterium]|nr:ribbon-helix-helix domain-containing protein [Actinomycetota bacterium]